ncbi:unnamed protein product, partial [Vitis vinifera]
MSITSSFPFCSSSLTFERGEKNWYIEINTIEIPKIKIKFLHCGPAFSQLGENEAP